MISPNEIKALQWEETNLYEIIAQDDDNDYSESGWVVIKDNKENKYAIGRYSHCSCYGTWSAIADWDWVGTLRSLLKLARNKLDPNMPERKADPEDYDYNHLMNVYNQVLEWDKNRKEKLNGQH